MKNKIMGMAATAVAAAGFGLAVLIPTLSAQARVSPNASTPTTYCEYNEYTETTQYGEYCESTTVTNGTTTVVTSPIQTISAGSNATPAAASVKTAYAAGLTKVTIGLPAGTLAAKYYFYTVHGVSFGFSHSYKLIKQDISVYNGRTSMSYRITALSKPHGRVHLQLSKPLVTSTFSVKESLFEFTAAERALIEKAHITETMVSVQVTSTTGKVYTVRFRAHFGKLIVVKFV